MIECERCEGSGKDPFGGKCGKCKGPGHYDPKYPPNDHIVIGGDNLRARRKADNSTSRMLMGAWYGDTYVEGFVIETAPDYVSSGNWVIYTDEHIVPFLESYAEAVRQGLKRGWVYLPY